jgi:hypothetical protein
MNQTNYLIVLEIKPLNKTESPTNLSPVQRITSLDHDAMKIFLLIFLALVAVDAQTVTDGLLMAQRELGTGHRFFQESISDSRATLSSFIENDVRQLIDSHMDAYASIQSTALETTAAIDELEVNERSEACLSAVRARWETQVSRYGQRLSQCIATPYRSEIKCFQ